MNIGTKNMSMSMRTVQVGLEWATHSLGGADRVFAELANHLPDEGVRFTGVVAGSPDLAVKTNGAIHSTAPLDSSTLSRVLGARRVIKSLCKDSKVDLIATHFALYAVSSLDIISKRPHVVHFHGPWAAESLQEGANGFATKAMRQIEKAVYSRADRVIVLSEAFAQVATRDYSVPREKLRIVPGSADIPRFAINANREEARASLGWPQDRKVLIAVRRLSARMGLDRLITAMASVTERFPDALLYIGGRGHMLEALMKQVADLNLGNSVKFLGFIPDDQLPLAYCAADLNVVPTLAWEGFGLVAAEALAAGTPSMVTPIGGLPEVVSALSPELLFRSTEPGDIAQGLIEALAGERKMPTASECRAYAAANFSSTLMAHRTAMVYRELV